jgi:hypothetical protein
VTNNDNGMSASVEALSLPAGVYFFSVKTGVAANVDGSPIPLPAIHVGPGPGVSGDQLEVMSRSGDRGGWLSSGGDFLVLRLKQPTTLVVTSILDAAGNGLSINAERLDSRLESASPSATSVARPAATPAATPMESVADTPESAGLPLEVTAHIRNQGDQRFRTAWAGRKGTGFWLESFAIRPLEVFGSEEIEYKGLTANGFETPWISNEQLCGTKGMGVSLIGFAVRLKPSAKAAAYDCEYYGYFQSGALVGPLKNGAPCRSNVANDPLEGVRIRLTKRKVPAGSPGPGTTARRAAPTVPRPTAPIPGPATKGPAPSKGKVAPASNARGTARAVTSPKGPAVRGTARGRAAAR